MAGISAWGEDEDQAWAKLFGALRPARGVSGDLVRGPWDDFDLWSTDTHVGGAEALAAGTDVRALHAAYEVARAALPPGWWVSDLTTRYHLAGRTPGLWYASATAPYLRLGDDSELDGRGAWGPDPIRALAALPARFD